MELVIGVVSEWVGVELLILGYLWYQFSYGVVKSLNDTIRSFVPVLLALSSQVDGVDENDVANTLNTDLETPGQLLTHDAPYSDSEVDQMEQIVEDERNTCKQND